MKRVFRLTAVAALACATVLPVAANAAPINRTYTFSLSGFSDAFSRSLAPSDSVAGSFTVTFDPTKNYDNDMTNLVVNAFSGTPVGSTLGFDFYQGYNIISFGGIANDATDVASRTNDFVLQLDVSNPDKPTLIRCSDSLFSCGKFSGNSAYTASAYTTVGQPNSIFFASSGFVSSATAVPEIATWAMMVLGMGAIGFAVRRQEVAKRVTYAA